MAKFDVIIPAGGTVDTEFERVVKIKNKALIAFEGVTILETTIAALRASGVVDRILLIGPPMMEHHPASRGRDIFIEEGKSGPENIFRGLEGLMETQQKPDQILLVMSDMPFLKAEAISSFLANCPPAASLCAPLISKESYLDLYPSSDGTFISLKGGPVTLGGLYKTTAPVLLSAVSHVETIFQQRKSKLGMAKLLGFGTVAKMLAKQLKLEEVEAKVSSILGCSVQAARNCDASLAFDIDFLDDYYYALNNLKAHKRAI